MMPPFFSFEALAIAEMPLDNASTPAYTFHQGFTNHLACPSGHPNLAGITRKDPQSLSRKGIAGSSTAKGR
jgi:hypothetical protein